MNAMGWLDSHGLVMRTFSEVTKDRVTLVAAGVTFYALLASFPALAVLVTLYGFVADPANLGDQIQFLSTILPPGSLDLVLAQLKNLATEKSSTLSIAFLISFGATLWSANSGMKALFDAMNVAYDEDETRSFVALNLQSLCFTVGALIMAVALVIAMAAVPVVLAFIRLDAWAEILTKIARWPIVAGLMLLGTIALYRYGPARQPPAVKSVVKGAVFSTLTWMIVTVGFSFYLENFANYNAAYGALGALIGFLVWIWLSVIVLVVGAELNTQIDPTLVHDASSPDRKPLGQPRRV